MEAGLVDELIVYLAPKFMGQGLPLLQLPEVAKMSEVRSWRIAESRRVGEDLKLTLKP
jgi:diaminohydroxyphosphoribosylaminopyrimidine deaminase/5-amino-6-(5-phosphoribosylamino)uracil reductase